MAIARNRASILLKKQVEPGLNSPSEDRNAREFQLLIDFFAKETGGQMHYKGRDMALTYQGKGITAADWTRFIEIVVSVAGDMGVGETEGGEVMGFLDSFKADIVTA